MHLAKTSNFSSKLPCFGVLVNFSAKSCKKCLISSKNTKNHRFGQNLQLFEQTTMSWHFYELFRKKLQKVAQFVKKHEKSSIWPKLCNFSNKLPSLCISMNFYGKSCKKCLISSKSTKNHRFGQNFATFRTNYHVFAFRSTFREKVANSASFRETARKIIDLAKALQLLEQATMSLSFWWTFKKKVAKSASSREKARKMIDFVNLQLSEKTTMFWRFDKHCSKKLQKAARAVRKHEKSSIWPNLCNFSKKLPCFCISMNFQGKSCQKCFVSWKSTKNHRFGQNFATFRANYHVLAFRWSFQQKVPHFVKKHGKSSIWRKLATFPTNYHVLTLWWTFQRKVAESASFPEKNLKIIDWAKTCNFFEQSTMFMPFDELFSKRLQKVPRFVKKHEKSSIWPKLATFRTNYHVLAFRWTFQEKSAKSGPFREKARTLIDLAKTCNFSNKLPCFGISMIIAGKSCKKVEKVAHFVKNDEKLSILPKLATFWGNYHVSAFLSTFQQKVSHFAKKHEKSSFGSCLAHS